MSAQTNSLQATGRRKTATARVWLTPGSGQWIINNRPWDQYFPLATLRHMVNQPFSVTDTEGKFDVQVRVRGGGHGGQAGAVRHAVARALLAYDAHLKPVLRRHGLLTRDPRMKERKKPGQPGARKRFQFSKR